jgi:hypothetical protein
MCEALNMNFRIMELGTNIWPLGSTSICEQDFFSGELVFRKELIGVIGGDLPVYDTGTALATDLAALATISIVFFCSTVFVEYLVMNRLLKHPSVTKAKLAFWVFLSNILTKPAFLFACLYYPTDRTTSVGEILSVLGVGIFLLISAESVLLNPIFKHVYPRSVLSAATNFFELLKLTLIANVASSVCFFFCYFFLSDLICLWSNAVIRNVSNAVYESWA